MARKFSQEEIDTAIKNRNKEFPMYPPSEGNTIAIEMLDDTFAIFAKDEEDLLGDTDPQFTRVETRVRDLDKDRERVFRTYDFNKLPGLLFHLVKENGENPLKMKGLQFRIDGLPGFKYDIEYLGREESGADETKLTPATKKEIKEVANFFEEEDVSEEELILVVKEQLETEGKSSTEEEIRKVIGKKK